MVQYVLFTVYLFNKIPGSGGAGAGDRCGAGARGGAGVEAGAGGAGGADRDEADI